LKIIFETGNLTPPPDREKPLYYESETGRLRSPEIWPDYSGYQETRIF